MANESGEDMDTTEVEKLPTKPVKPKKLSFSPIKSLQAWMDKSKQEKLAKQTVQAVETGDEEDENPAENEASEIFEMDDAIQSDGVGESDINPPGDSDLDTDRSFKSARISFGLPTLQLVGTPVVPGTSSSDDEQDDMRERSIEPGSDYVETGEEDKEKSGNQPSSSSGYTEKKKRSIKRSDLAFRQSAKIRTQHAKLRAVTLQQKCNEHSVMFGSKVYLKVEYTSATGITYPYKFGENFLFRDETETALTGKPDALQKLIKDAVASGLQSHLLSTPGVSHLPLSQGVEMTPTMPARVKARRPGACIVCNNTEETIKLLDHRGGVTKSIPSLFLACSHEDEEGVLCKFVVHTDCVGFPGVNNETLALMPNWYCRMHMPDGRAEVAANLAIAKTTKTSACKKKKGTAIEVQTQEAYSDVVVKPKRSYKKKGTKSDAK